MAKTHIFSVQSHFFVAILIITCTRASKRKNRAIPQLFTFLAQHKNNYTAYLSVALHQKERREQLYCTDLQHNIRENIQNSYTGAQHHKQHVQYTGTVYSTQNKTIVDYLQHRMRMNTDIQLYSSYTLCAFVHVPTVSLSRRQDEHTKNNCGIRWGVDPMEDGIHGKLIGVHSPSYTSSNPSRELHKAGRDHHRVCTLLS